MEKEARPNAKAKTAYPKSAPAQKLNYAPKQHDHHPPLPKEMMTLSATPQKAQPAQDPPLNSRAPLPGTLPFIVREEEGNAESIT
ncbi:hypothetical protein V6N11_064446 [Hibiscus sabdariffa]|uniref:Uncharacterized protein n=1 Tax=Hibiscus sabdariffa TaxID=183260 RepID=A0ABR2P9R3_9ROSI